MLIKFWKSIGGYEMCIKWRGRWHYAGRRPGGAKMLREKGYEVERVGLPTTVERAWATHGHTVVALKRGLPNIDLDTIPAAKDGK